VLKALEGLALVKATKSEEDGVVTVAFHADGADLADDTNTLVKIGPDMVAVFKNFKGVPAKNGFSEAVAKAGFIDHPTAIRKSMAEAAEGITKSEGLDAVTGVLKDYAEILDLHAQVPATVVKAEADVVKIVKDAADAAELAKKNEGKDMPEGVEKDKWDKMSPAEKDACVAKKKDPEPVAKTDPDALAGLTKLVTDLGTTVAGLVDQVKKNAESTEEKIAEIARKAETAANAVKNTVNAGPGGKDDPDKGEPVKKKEDDWRSGAFDSAFRSKE
jgi:hypothetical protein